MVVVPDEMDPEQLIPVLVVQPIPVVGEVVGPMVLPVSKTLEEEVELEVIDVLYPVKTLVVVHLLNQHLL